MLANFGLAFLFFLAGFEIDFPPIRGRPILLASLGWLASLIVCLGVGLGLQGCGIVDSGLIVGAALATTALGMLMPILGDAQELPTPCHERTEETEHGCTSVVRRTCY